MKTAVPSHSFTRLIMDAKRLRREGYGSRSGKCAGEAGEHHEVGGEGDLLDAANADRAEAPLMLQAPELARASRPAWAPSTPPGNATVNGVATTHRIDVDIDTSGRPDSLCSLRLLSVIAAQSARRSRPYSLTGLVAG